jgi:hypothetical protein
MFLWFMAFCARGAEEKKYESDVYLADDKSGR